MRTVEYWRGATLPMGVLYEGAAVVFWNCVANEAGELAGTGEAEGRTQGRRPGIAPDTAQDAGSGPPGTGPVRGKIRPGAPAA